MGDISHIKCSIPDQSEIILTLAEQNLCRPVGINSWFGSDRTTKINSVMTELTQSSFESPLFGSNVQFAIFTLYPLQMKLILR